MRRPGTSELGSARQALRSDDEALDQFEYDPRWEVQPEPAPEDVPGSTMRTVLMAAVAMAVVVVLLSWLLASAAPAF